MKKTLLILILAGVLAGGIFAQAMPPMSAGVYGGGNFGGATDSDLKTTWGGGGFGVFGDMTYIVFNLGLDFTTASYDGTEDPNGATTYLSFELLGKYPFKIGSAFSIAPAVGIEYQMYLNYNGWGRGDVEALATLVGLDEDKVLAELDNWTLKFGLIADYSFTSNIYARLSALAGLQFAHPEADPADTGFGADISLGVGYKF